METRLIQIELGELKKIGRDLAEIIKQRLGTEITIKGSILTISDPTNGHVSMKDAKFQVKHALHQLKLSEDYRVLSERHIIHLVRVEEKKTHYVERGEAPAPSRSLPYFFPG